MNLAGQNFAEREPEPERWAVYRTRFVVRARQLTEPLVFIDALGREQSGRTGDYLVETAEGLKRITTKALFEDIYVRLAQDLVQDLPQEREPVVLGRPVSRASPENRARASA